MGNDGAHDLAASARRGEPSCLIHARSSPKYVRLVLPQSEGTDPQPRRSIRACEGETISESMTIVEFGERPIVTTLSVSSCRLPTCGGCSQA